MSARQRHGSGLTTGPARIQKRTSSMTRMFSRGSSHAVNANLRSQFGNRAFHEQHAPPRQRLLLPGPPGFEAVRGGRRAFRRAGAGNLQPHDRRELPGHRRGLAALQFSTARSAAGSATPGEAGSVRPSVSFLIRLPIRVRDGPGRIRSGAARHAPPVNTLRPKPMRTAGRIFTVAAGAAAAFACSGLRAPTSAPKLEFASEPPAAPGPGPTQSGGAPEADWWTSFGVPELDRVVERALARNLTLGAGGGAASPKPPPKPAWRGGRSSRRSRPARPGSRNGGTSSACRSPASPKAKSSPPTMWPTGSRSTCPGRRTCGGRPRLGRGRARAGFEAAVAEVAGARVSLAGQAARLYFLAVEARQQARLAEAAAANREQTARWMRDRARIGEAALAAADAAEARAAEAQAAAASRREAAAAAIRALEVLFAEYPDGVPGPGGRSPPASPRPGGRLRRAFRPT